MSTLQIPKTNAKRKSLLVLINNHTLLSYFILTFIVTWIFLGPFVYLWRVVLEGSFKLWLFIFLPGAYGPTIAALLIVFILKGKTGIKHLLSSLLIWRVKWQWYLFVLFVPFVLIIIAICFSGFRQVAFVSFDASGLLTAIPLYLLLALPFGPMGEELGWRGFALPKLQARFHPFISSLILGTIWTFWHTPMFWFPGAAIPSFLNLSLFSLFLYWAQITAEAVLFTAVFNRTKNSVFLAILFHLTFNATNNIIFSTVSEPSYSQKLEIYIINIIVMWILALISIVFLSNKRSD